MNYSLYIRLFLVGILLFVGIGDVSAEIFKLNSPDGAIVLTVQVEENVQYSVEKNGEVLISPSQIELQSPSFTDNLFSSVVRSTSSDGADQFDLVWGTCKSVDHSYNALTLWLSENLSIKFRAYNSGVAWRYVTNYKNEIIIENEIAQFNFTNDELIYFPEVDGFSNPFEPEYLPEQASDVEKGKLGLTPFMISKKSGHHLLITEVNLFSYPGMFIHKTETGCNAVFPAYPAKEREQFLGRMRLVNIPQFSKMMVIDEEYFISSRNGDLAFPWRTIIIADNEADLLTNNLVSCLADKPQENQFDWVKPGKVVWDWYHKWNLTDVDFKPGINTETYKYMIDFAVENNLQYVNIDDGWCSLHNFSNINGKLDLAEVIDYAKKKDIGIFLWATWQTLNDGLEENLDMFQDIGIAGLKVDFFDRCDQVVVDFINTLSQESANRHLLLNLHGMYKPTGIQVTYPNVVNLEGVMGLEYNKFTAKCTPQHNLTIPYIRNVVGPMDYTPGGMFYMEQENFKKSWKNPHVMTTKAQQMAMYVVYHGGVQMLADSPTMYEQDKIALKYLSEVPVSWDESIALQGEIGESIAIARRSGDIWYVAAMNGENPVDIELSFDFLKTGEYSATLWENAEEIDQLKTSTISINSNEKQTYSLAKASGLVLQIRKQ